MDIQQLIDTLKEQTQILKEEYVEKTREWAEKEYDRWMKFDKYTAKQWCEYFGIEPRPFKHKDPRYQWTMPKGFYGSKYAKEYYKLTDKAASVRNLGHELFVERATTRAEQHYESSIEKLAHRIVKKGIVLENAKVETARVSVNIETTITDGEKTVRAWTIVASGEIQKPHYRYLIK